MVDSLDLLCPVGASVSLIRKSGPKIGSLSSGCWLRGPPPSTGSLFLRATLWHPQCFPSTQFFCFEPPFQKFLPHHPPPQRLQRSREQEGWKGRHIGRDSRQGVGLSFCLTGASLVAQMVKCLPTM